MPWWFWVITHIWIFASGVMITASVNEEEPWWICAIVTLFSLPILIIGTAVEAYNEWIPEKYREKIKNNWFTRICIKMLMWCWKYTKKPIEWMGRQLIRRPLKWIVFFKERRQDHKLMDEKEDEWRIERLGIK